MPRYATQRVEEPGSSIDTNPITNPNGAKLKKTRTTAGTRNGKKTFAQMNEAQRMEYLEQQRRAYERKQEELAGVQAMAAGEATKGIIPHPTVAESSRVNTPRPTAEQYWSNAQAADAKMPAAQQARQSQAAGTTARRASSYLTGGSAAAGPAYAAAAQGRQQAQAAQQQRLAQQQREQQQSQRQRQEQAAAARTAGMQAEMGPEYWAQAAQAAAQTGDKETAFDVFNAYMDANPLMKDLFAIDTGTYQPAESSQTRRVVNPVGRFGAMPAYSGNTQVKSYAEQIRAGMTEQETATYQQMLALYNSYGGMWSLGHRIVQNAAGLGQQIGGSFAALKDTAVQAVKDAAEEAASEENKVIRQARERMDKLAFNGGMYTTDENGQRVLSEEYRAAMTAYRNAQRAMHRYYQGTVLTPETSGGVAMYQEGSERLARAQAGLSDATQFALGTGNSIVANAPAMAASLIPYVGQAVSLGLMGAQAAGGRAAELSLQGEAAGSALARGLVSGGIEIATERVPVGEWVNLIKGKNGRSALAGILRQMGSEATEEAVSYVANYAADAAAQDPNAEFSLQELAESALGGAISGGVYGTVGVGINRALSRRSATQDAAADTENAQQAARQEEGTAKNEGENPVQDPQTRLVPGKSPVLPDWTPEQWQAAWDEVIRSEEGEIQQAARPTYEQAMADELGKLFGLQPNATTTQTAQQSTAAEMADAGAGMNDGTARRAAEWNRRALAQAAAASRMDEAAARAMAADYDGTANPAVYAKAWTDAYHAGRTGSLTEAQALRAAGSAAAVSNQQDALRHAYALGAESAGSVAAGPAGAAQRGGTVEYRGIDGSVTPDEVLQAVAARYGVDIDVVEHLATDAGDEANGMWAANIARITLGENSGNSYQTLQHELTHYIASENPEGWARLKNTVLNYAAQRGGMEGLREQAGRYEQAYEGGAVAADELARDILAGVMSTEENVQAFCEHVAADTTRTPTEKRGILQALRDVLDRVIETLRRLVRGGDATSGSEYGRKLAEAEDSRQLVEEYLAELDAAAEVQRGGVQAAQQDARQQNAPAASAGAVAYSIRQDEQGQPFVEIDDDILEGVAQKDVLKTVRNEIRRRYPDGFKRHGWKIKLNSQGVREFLRSRSSQQLQKNRPEVFADKLRMTANLDEIVQTAEQWRNEAPKHKRKDNLVKFRRGNVRIRVGRNDYNAEIVTGLEHSRREIFYDLVGIRPTTIRTPTAIQVGAKDTLTPVGASRGSNNNNISQQNQAVNPTAQSDEQLREQSRKLGEEIRQLKEERDAWENSEPVRQMRERRAQMKAQMGLFGLKEWDASTPEWQDYLNRRRQYNERSRQLREQQDAVDEQLRKSVQAAAEKRNQTAAAAYEDAVRKSGMSREEYRRKKAVELYGTTERFEEAGYILPDGRMLDFKGEGGPAGQRGMDHRQVAEVFAPQEMGDTTTAHMNRFIVDGNVRVMGEEPGVDISAEARPSRAQLEQIRKMADSLGAAKHKFGLDISTADGKQAATRWYEGRVRGERVVQDILAYFRDGKLPAADEMDSYRYSRTAESDGERDFARENRELARRNMRLEEQVQLLKEETKLSEGHRFDPRRVRQLARRMVQDYESGYDPAQLETELTRLFEYIANEPDANYTDIMDTAQQLMRGVLEQSSRANTDLQDAYKPIVDDLKGMTFEVQKNSPAYHELLNAFGDGEGGAKWSNVRRNMGGNVKLKLVDGPGNWDGQFMELAENYPNVFDESQGIEYNIRRALEVAEASEPIYENPYGMDLDTAALDAAEQLFEEYMEMPERHTYADRQRQKALETRARYKEQRRRALQAQKARFEQRLETVREQNRQKEQQLKAEGKEQLARQKEKLDAWTADKLEKQQAVFDERMARRNEGLNWRQARDQAEKNLRRLNRWMLQPTDAQHVPETLRHAVGDVLNAVNFNVHKAGSRAEADLGRALLEIQQHVTDPDPSGDSLEYADFDVDLKDEIKDFVENAPKDKDGRISAKDLSAAQMKRLNGILTSVTHSITTANRLLADGQNARLAEVAGESVEELNQRAASRLRERRGLVKKALDTDLGETAENVAGLDMMDAGSYFRSMGPAAEKIYRAIRKGFDTRTFKIRDGQEFMQNLLRGKKLAEWSGDKAPKQKFTTEAGKTLELTPGQVMELYCLTQRKQAHQHLVVGGVAVELRPGKLSSRVPLTPTDIGKIVASLTPEQVRVAKAMQNYLSTTVAGWGNETSMELYGIRKFGEKNYWPIKTSDNYTRTNDANSGEPGLWGIKNAGMTKAVKINANNPLVLHDAFDTWYNHVAQMASYNGWAIPLSDAMKWYNWHDKNNASVKEAIEGLYGKKGKNYFTTLVKDLNGMSDRPSRTGLDKALSSLTRPWKVAKVGANLRVIIQQPTSYLRAAAVIDPKYLAQALAQAPTQWTRAIKNAERYSGISQWARWGYFETNIGQSMRSVMIGDQSTAERLQEMATAPAAAMDRITRGVLWLASEDEVRAAHPELQGEQLMRAVADRMDEIIDRTQVVDTVLSRSHLMRSKNPLTQMAMNFMAEPTKSWNLMREAAVEVAHTQPKSNARKAAWAKMRRVTATYVVTALGTAAAAALIDSWRVHDDDKDKAWLERYMAALRENFIDNANLLGSLPLVKDIFSLAEGYDIERTDMAAFGEMIDSYQLLAKTVQGKGNASPYDLIRALSEPVSALTGIPLSNAQRELKSLYDLLTNLQDPLRVDRSIFADPEAVSYLDMVAQVRGESGGLGKLKQLYGTSGSGAATYAEMLGGDQAEKVDKWLESLSEKTSKNGKANTAVLPRRVSNKVSWSQDGQDVVQYLSGPEYLSYAEAVQKTTCQMIAEYMDGAGKDAAPEEQAEFVEQARDYAVETARADALLDYTPDDWAAEIKASGGDAVQQIVARMTIKGAQGDKDADGKTISGSKAKNAVERLVDQGYTVAEARAAYEQAQNPEDSAYLALFDDVKGSASQANELAALFGASGKDATYAEMLGKTTAKRVDSYLQNLAKTAGDDVLPDYMTPEFTYTQDGQSKTVELDGKKYISYAGQRTETAYDLLSLFVNDAKRLPADTQADVVRAVETYATQTAKASVSDYEPDYKWVETVQKQANGNLQTAYELVLARQLISSAQGQKDANGRTISGTKKEAALNDLQKMGYEQAYAQELYKLFG